MPEDDVRYVHIGDQLQVRVDAIGRSFTGKIVRFTREVNFETRTMETEVDVENKDLSISPGMYANTLLQLGHVASVVTIPVEALVLNSQRETVYVLDGSNRIHIRNVTVGLQGSKLAEITSGLNPGDRVVIGGQDKYQENEEVNALDTRRAGIGDRPGDGWHDRHEGRCEQWRRALMPKFALRFPYFIIMLCLLVSLVGVVNIATDAGRSVSQDRHAGGGGGHVLQRHASAADRSRHYEYL